MGEKDFRGKKGKDGAGEGGGGKRKWKNEDVCAKKNMC